MKVMWNHIVVAGVGGLLCGNLAAIARKHSNTTTYLLGCTAAISTVGVATGVGVALYRKAPIHVYAISLGANFAVSSFSFFGFRHILATKFLSRSGFPMSEDASSKKLRLLPWEGYFISGASGGLTGTLLSLLSRCSVPIVTGTCVGGVLVGLVGQVLYVMLNSWRMRRGVQLHYPDLAPPPSKKWTLNRFESWFVGFWNQISEASRLQTQLTVLKKDIASEKKALAKLDGGKATGMRGIPSSSSNNDW